MFVVRRLIAPRVIVSKMLASYFSTVAPEFYNNHLSPNAISGMEPMKVTRVHLKSIDSTNTFAKQNASQFDPAVITAITADEQTAGRGRLGRQWVSSGDDITITFAFHIPSSAVASAYQLSPLLSLVACKAIATQGVKADIKWPNDIILSGCKKAGGILCELEDVGGKYWAALGLGLNVNSEPAVFGLDRPVWPLSTLRAEAGRRFDVPALTNEICAQMAEVCTDDGGCPLCLLFALYGCRTSTRVRLASSSASFRVPRLQALPTFLAHGFAPFQRQYEALSLLLGKTIKFNAGDVVVQGKVVRIGEDGKLYIQAEGSAGGTDATAGSVQGYLSGEVSGVELVHGSGEMIHGSPDAT